MVFCILHRRIIRLKKRESARITPVANIDRILIFVWLSSLTQIIRECSNFLS